MQLQVPGRKSDRAPQSRWGWLLCIVLGLWLVCGGPGVCPAPRRAGSSHTALPACTGELGGSKAAGECVWVCKFLAWCVCAVCACGVWCECNKIHVIKMNTTLHSLLVSQADLLESVECKFLAKVTLSFDRYHDYLRVWPLSLIHI